MGLVLLMNAIAMHLLFLCFISFLYTEIQNTSYKVVMTQLQSYS